MSTYLSDILSNIHDALPDNYLLSVEGIDRIDNIEQKVKNRFDGILVVSQSAADNQFIYKMKTNHIPMVVVLRKMDNPEIDNIYPDDERAILDAVNYIADRGHQRIGFIEGRPEFEATIARRRGIEIGCAANHLVLVDDAVKVGDFSPAAGKELMAEILQLPVANRPTCVICANDDMALGAMRACYERGVKVPDDISIMGFDNVAYARLSTPSLTTINNPIQEMASAGIKRLISIIDNPHQERLSMVMTPALVIRESIGQQN
jgi:LacI family transcriptional regulator